LLIVAGACFFKTVAYFRYTEEHIMVCNWICDTSG